MSVPTLGIKIIAKCHVTVAVCFAISCKVASQMDPFAISKTYVCLDNLGVV
jgi:hypothetical protein